jgi:hypothetical protein
MAHPVAHARCEDHGVSDALAGHDEIPFNLVNMVR